MDGESVLQQRSFAYLAKQGRKVIYKWFEVVNILSGLELFSDTQVQLSPAS